MSESDDEEYLNFYSTSNTKTMFRKQIGMLKKPKNVEIKQVSQPISLPPNSENESASVNAVPLVSCDDSTSEPANCSSTLLDDGFTFPDELLVDTARTADGPPAEEVLESPDKSMFNNVEMETTHRRRAKKNTSKSSTLAGSLLDDGFTFPDQLLVDTARTEDKQMFDNAVMVEKETTHRRRSKRNTSKSSDALNDNIIFLDEDTTPPKRSKRTTRNSSKQLTMVDMVETMNTKPKRLSKKNTKDDSIQEIYIEDTPEDSREDDINYHCNVKIVWKSADVVKIPVRRLQKLNVVFEHFMKEENVDLEKIILTLNDKKVKPTDTPESLNLNITDFLEGGIVSTNVSYQLSQTNDSKFSIKFQDCSRQSLTLPVKYQDKMKAVLLGYAEQIDKPLTGLKFMFDGCAINYDDTPESLGMENGDVVDVIVKN